MEREKRMQSDTFNKMLEIIKASPQNLLYEGATQEEIAKTEGELGFPLPKSYRRFLELTDGALLYQNEELFGTKDGEDGIQTSIGKTKNEIDDLPGNLIPFSFSNRYYFFDVNEKNDKDDKEYKVVALNINKKGKIELVSESFPEWLDEFIIQEYEI